MDIRAAEISAILKDQIKNFGSEAHVTEVGQVLWQAEAAHTRSTAHKSIAGYRQVTDGVGDVGV